MKLSHFLFTAVAMTTLVGCGNHSQVTEEGMPAGNTPDEAVANLVWPNIDNGYRENGDQFGTWPNWDNVRMIERGLTKEQIVPLIGIPQFDEGLAQVREWDYAFNYRENNGQHKICQYKILFDKDMRAQSFYWYPNGCNGNASFNLTGDFLFDFNNAVLSERGQKIIANLAEQLNRMGAESVKVSGYTDRLGSESYNLNLSQKRADSVRNELLRLGVTANISAVGLGKANQVKSCSDVTDKTTLHECLRPNRRVEVLAYGKLVKDKDAKEGGTIGPVPLYEVK